jgi:hypothetical protein
MNFVELIAIALALPLDLILLNSVNHQKQKFPICPSFPELLAEQLEKIQPIAQG